LDNRIQTKKLSIKSVYLETYKTEINI